jgi:hypothetical protein
MGGRVGGAGARTVLIPRAARLAQAFKHNEYKGRPAGAMGGDRREGRGLRHAVPVIL